MNNDPILTIKDTPTYFEIKHTIESNIMYPYQAEYLSLLEVVADQAEDEGELMVQFEYVILDIKANAVVMQKALHYIMEEYRA